LTTVRNTLHDIPRLMLHEAQKVLSVISKRSPIFVPIIFLTNGHTEFW
jgi:hypothetical protein